MIREFYVDGSCRTNGEKNAIGAYGWLMINNDGTPGDRRIIKEYNTTNQRCEMLAILTAGQFAYTNYPDDTIIIYTDSAYCYNAWANHWINNWKNKTNWLTSKKQPVKNRDLWEKLDIIFQYPNIQLSKVRGHQNYEMNNLIDNLVTTMSGRITDDLTNKIFGELTVVTLWDSTGNGTRWKCKCSCGDETIVTRGNLISGGTQTCGNHKKHHNFTHAQDLRGIMFGFLEPYEQDVTDEDGYARWKCICHNCNSYLSVSSRQLKSGQISCGCIKSKGETKIAQLLTELNYIYNREISFNDLKDKSRLKFDFGIYQDNQLICLIEYQGIQHYFSNMGLSSWNTDTHLQKLQYHDELKREYCRKNNIKLVEIPYTDYNKLDKFYIKERINQ